MLLPMPRLTSIFVFSLGKQSRVIFRKQPLIRSRQTAYKRQAELTAVRMAAQDKVRIAGYVNLKQLRSVGKQ